MIISHEHQYLFIEIPLTASWAIRHELCECYGGEPILHKHATYPEFLAVAQPDERDYLAFATVRNPLDVAVSRYFKYMTDHKGAFSGTGEADVRKAEYSDLKKYQFIAGRHASFQDYFKEFHRRVFSNTLEVSAGHLDFVIRYEDLEQDFSEVLQLLGRELVRPVPVMNKTKERRHDWESYYSPDIVGLAKRNFGPYMEKWGYQFPSGWGEHAPARMDRLRYRLLKEARSLYVLHVRYNDGATGRALRFLRSLLLP